MIHLGLYTEIIETMRNATQIISVMLNIQDRVEKTTYVPYS